MKLDGSKVRWHRDRLGWTLDVLAEKAEVAKGTVLRAEHEEDIRPGSGRRIARAFGVELPDLIPERPDTTSPKGVGPLPLSPEWAHNADPDVFRRTIQDTPTERLQSLVLDLVSEYQPQTLEDLAKASPEEVYQRVVDFSRARIVNEELRQRGEEPPERYVLALKRFQDAMSGEISKAVHEDNQEHQAG